MDSKKMLVVSAVLAFCAASCADPVQPNKAVAVPRPNLLLAPTGMANPIADMRYYNGTYMGTPGTGTQGYRNEAARSPGTLYRDNEDGGSVAGCVGEGCGSHPGTDIPAPTGSSVYASYSGTVIKAECTTNGWGGLVIIQATSPYNSAETIYFSYAHLKQWFVSANQFVTTGTLIAKSGGGTSDYCHGNSTGAHLHYQIDRNTGHTVPWFPSAIGRSVNTPDSDFRVTQYTYNPGSFVVGGYYWTFWNNPNPADQGFKEYWSAVNVSSFTVSGDAAVIDGNSDPYIWRGSSNVTCTDITGSTKPCSSRIAVEASLYNKVGLDVAFGCRDDPFKVYFITKDSPNWDEAKSVSSTPPPNGGEFHINMGGNSYWTGIVTGIRLDPAGNCSSGYDPIYSGYLTIERSNH